MSRIFKELLQLNHNNSNNKTTPFKSGQMIWIDIFSKKTYKWPTSMWKDSPPLVTRENADQNTKCYVMTIKIGIIKKKRKVTSIGEEVEKLELCALLMRI
jgi:hypothetical protein